MGPGVRLGAGRQPADAQWLVAADIGGALNAGLPGVWLHRGRPWPLSAFQPGHIADSFADAVDIVLTANR